MKGKYIKKLVQKEDVKFFVIQEYKKEMVDNNFCHSLWGHGDMEWLASPVVGAYGDLLLGGGEKSQGGYSLIC